MNIESVVSGFGEDMEQLFESFLTLSNTSTNERSETVSLRFTRFSYCWRQMNFSLVFRYRFHENDLREFIEEMFLLVLPNVCREYGLDRRVSALYLLYSLFVKQPKTIEHKIRINFSYLNEIRELVNTCKQLQQLDVCFIWYKLLSLGAIDLVLVSRQMSPNMIRNSRTSQTENNKIDFLVNKFKTSTHFYFNELSQIHEKYQTFKKELGKNIPEMDQISGSDLNIIENYKIKADQMLKSFTINSNNSLKQLKTSTTKDRNEFKENKLNKDSNIAENQSQLKERSLICDIISKNKRNVKTIQLKRKYESTTKETEDIVTGNQKKGKGRRGRPKTAKWN